MMSVQISGCDEGPTRASEQTGNQSPNKNGPQMNKYDEVRFANVLQDEEK